MGEMGEMCGNVDERDADERGFAVRGKCKENM